MQTATGHSLQTNPIFSPKIPTLATGTLFLGAQPVQSRSQGYTIPQAKRNAVVVEAAALQLPVHIPAQQPGASEDLYSGMPELTRGNADTALQIMNL